MDLLERLLAERVRTLEKLHRFDVAIQVAKELDGVPTQEAVPAAPKPPDAEIAAAPRTPARAGPLVQHTRDLVAEILQAEGRPMSKEELLEALHSRKVVIEGKDPAANLHARLSQPPCESLTFIRGVGWDLKERAQGTNILGLPLAGGFGPRE